MRILDEFGNSFDIVAGPADTGRRPSQARDIEKAAAPQLSRRGATASESL